MTDLCLSLRANFEVVESTLLKSMGCFTTVAGLKARALLFRKPVAAG